MIKVERYSVPVETLLVQRHLYSAPEYQRESVWSDWDQMALIDYMLRGYPIDPIAVYDEGDVTKIHDGWQRFNTILDFIDGYLRTFSGVEFRLIEPSPKISLLPSMRHFKELPVDLQRIFRRYMVPFEKMSSEMDEEERRFCYRRRNEGGVKLSVAEILYSYPSKAIHAAKELSTHTFFTYSYKKKDVRKQKLHMALFAICLETLTGSYQALRASNLKPVAAGIVDDKITPELVQTIDETLTGSLNLFQGLKLSSTTNFIVIYQAALKLRNNGYDLLGSNEGCLLDWYNDMRKKCNDVFRGEIWNNLEQLNSQREFWEMSERSMFRQKGLIKLNLFSNRIGENSENDLKKHEETRA